MFFKDKLFQNFRFRKKRLKACFWWCFRKGLLCLSFPNDPHIYMLQSTQYIIHLVVEKGSNFAVLFYFFFNWSSGFVFLQLHGRNYMTEKLDTANVLTFGVNRLLLIALSQMCVNCFLSHTHGCKIYPITLGVMSIFYG